MSENPTSGRPDFDELARGLANGSLSRRRALKLFVATALGSLVPARFAAADPPEKVTICHKPGTPAEKTMDLPESAVPDHLGHGDFLGECGETTATTTTTTTSTTSTTMCLPDGGTCSSGTECCSGICGPGGTCTCIAPGESFCTNNSQCCNGESFIGLCFSGLCLPCVRSGFECQQADPGCCSGTCGPDFICT